MNGTDKIQIDGITRLAAIAKGLSKSLNAPIGGAFLTVPTPELPDWCEGIFEKLKLTIFKQTEALRGADLTDMYNIGIMAGIMARAFSFYRHDEPAIVGRESLSNLTAVDEARIIEKMNFEALRPGLCKLSGVPIDSSLKTETVLEQEAVKRFTHLEKLSTVLLTAGSGLPATQQFFLLE